MILILYFICHLIGDFFLQPEKWVIHKETHKWKSPWLYIHILIHFLLLCLATINQFRLEPILFICISHLLIDLSKISYQNENNKSKWFLVDQALHLIVLVLVWFVFYGNGNTISTIYNNRTITIGATILFLTMPTSHLIKNLIAPWTIVAKEILPTTLNNSGRYIGILERLLILIFILNNHWEGVGFLLTAKSVFRFGDVKEAKEMKLTEYFLIGTLLSFGIAILISLICYKVIIAQQVAMNM